MKIIMKCVFGSHLYGLNTPASDKDYKGVFIPSAEDILLQKAPKTISANTNNTNIKNTSEDVDCELFSYHKFLEMVSQGQTAALELLFVPDELIIEKTPEWDAIVKNRDVLLSKRIDSFLGYCRTQANKYGVKGERLATLEKVLETLNSYNQWKKIYEVWEDVKLFHEKTEYVNFIAPDKINKLHHNTIEICGRKFQDTVNVKYVVEALTKIYDGYGHRAQQAKTSEGIDWKAVSHAVRICHEGIEFLLEKKITLPLEKEAKEYILNVKLGKIPYSDVQKKLDKLMADFEIVKEQSSLPEKIDHKILDDMVCQEYYKVIKSSSNVTA